MINTEKIIENLKGPADITQLTNTQLKKMSAYFQVSFDFIKNDIDSNSLDEKGKKIRERAINVFENSRESYDKYLNELCGFIEGTTQLNDLQKKTLRSNIFTTTDKLYSALNEFKTNCKPQAEMLTEHLKYFGGVTFSLNAELLNKLSEYMLAEIDKPYIRCKSEVFKLYNAVVKRFNAKYGFDIATNKSQNSRREYAISLTKQELIIFSKLFRNICKKHIYYNTSLKNNPERFKHPLFRIYAKLHDALLRGTNNETMNKKPSVEGQETTNQPRNTSSKPTTSTKGKEPAPSTSLGNTGNSHTQREQRIKNNAQTTNHQTKPTPEEVRGMTDAERVRLFNGNVLTTKKAFNIFYNNTPSEPTPSAKGKEPATSTSLGNTTQREQRRENKAQTTNHQTKPTPEEVRGMTDAERVRYYNGNVLTTKKAFNIFSNNTSSEPTTSETREMHARPEHTQQHQSPTALAQQTTTPMAQESQQYVNRHKYGDSLNPQKLNHKISTISMFENASFVVTPKNT